MGSLTQTAIGEREMGMIQKCLPVLGLLLFSCFAVDEDNNKISISRRCKNPLGKNNQLKNIGCKTAVCMKGEGGQNTWKECKQPATEEKQMIIIEHLQKMIGLLELLVPGSTPTTTTTTTA